MSEKIQRYRNDDDGAHEPDPDGCWCLSDDVSTLEARLAEAEKERLLAGKAICSALGICHDYALSIPKIVADLDVQTYQRFVEANKEDALSARIRELEGANDRAFETCARIVEKDYLDDHYNERDKAQFTLNVARDRIAKKIRAARALKGEG